MASPGPCRISGIQENKLLARENLRSFSGTLCALEAHIRRRAYAHAAQERASKGRNGRERLSAPESRLSTLGGRECQWE
jgi:hypothetical protein